MNEKIFGRKALPTPVIITAGSAYLDIDAYACCVAMAELLQLKGINAIAYSTALCNYSVCKSLIEAGQVVDCLPSDCNAEDAEYIIADVSDPEFIKKAVPLTKIIEVYDHHVGFEDYWKSRIGENSHIEFIGAAATLIFREWKKAGLLDRMTRATALLLIAAILDNTLNLMSSNTTQEDIDAFHELCGKEDIDKEWCAAYFSEVQAGVEADLRNALMGDVKNLRDTAVLPSRIAQLCVWDAHRILDILDVIRTWFDDGKVWMINIIDLQEGRSYFVCDDAYHQKEIERVFGVHFASGVARSSVPYLRKEIIKKAYFNH